MSLTDAMDKGAARLEADLVPATVTAVYPKPPQAAVPDDQLPALFLRPVSGPVDYTASQRIVVHGFEVIALVARTDDLPADYDAAMPLLEPVLAVFEANTSFGTATYYDAGISFYEIGPASFNDGEYLTLVMTASVKEKTAVSMA